MRDADRSSTPAAVPQAPPAPPALIIPSYAVRSGPDGTKVLTETVDLLSLAVPDTWVTPAPNPLTLPKVLTTFAGQVPPLAEAVQSLALVEQKAGIRLFAYEPAAPYAFVSVISFSTPAAKPFTAAGVAAVVALAAKKTHGIAVTGDQLPVGEVVQLNSSTRVDNQPIVLEVLVLVAGGRTLEIEMVAETDVAAIPAVFGQIAQSLRLS